MVKKLHSEITEHFYKHLQENCRDGNNVRVNHGTGIRMAEKPQQRLLLVGKCCGKNAACISRPYFIHFYTEIHNV